VERRRIGITWGRGELEEGGAGAHWDEVLILDCVGSGVSWNIDCYQSISFVGRRGVNRSGESIPVDRRGIWMGWSKRKWIWRRRERESLLEGRRGII